MRTRVVWSVVAALVSLGVVTGVLVGTGDDEEPTQNAALDAAAESPPGIPADRFFEAAQLFSATAPPPPPASPAEVEPDDESSPSTRVKDGNRGSTTEGDPRNAYAPRPPMGPATVPTTIPEYTKQFDPPLVIPPLTPPGNTEPYRPETVEP